MSIKDCIKFANENPLCYLATAEGDQPRVRALLFWYADETGFYLQSGSMKELVLQLRKNPKAEICFYRQEGIAGTMLRVSGSVEFLEDRELKAKALKDRPFLKGLGMASPDDPKLVLLRIPKGVAHFWTMKNNLSPKEYIKFGK
jgi:pyridoxamine 5'-phosphate oxidase